MSYSMETESCNLPIRDPLPIGNNVLILRFCWHYTIVVIFKIIIKIISGTWACFLLLKTHFWFSLMSLSTDPSQPKFCYMHFSVSNIFSTDPKSFLDPDEFPSDMLFVYFFFLKGKNLIVCISGPIVQRCP